MQKSKPTSKDLITTAIFSVLFAAMVFIGAMVLGMTPVTYVFLFPVMMIPCGIVWDYLRVKVPKRFCVFIQCAVLSLLMFLVGSGWWLSLSMLIGGIAAEVISGAGGYKSFRWNTAGYAAFGVILNVGGFCPILLASGYYYDYCMQNGMDAGYMNTLMSFVSPPILLLTTALTIVGAILGMWLGKAMLKKHFIKAGIA